MYDTDVQYSYCQGVGVSKYIFQWLDSANILENSHYSRENIEQLKTLINTAYRGSTGKHRWTTEQHLVDGERTPNNCL